MTYVPRTAEQIMLWLDKEVANNTQNWYQRCFSLARQSWSVPGGPASAIDAWDNWIPPSKKNTNRFTAPVGAIHYWRNGGAGHCAVQARRQSIVYSNDILRSGKVDKVFITKLDGWGGTYLGWSTRLGLTGNSYQYDLKVPLTPTQLQIAPQPAPVLEPGESSNGHVVIVNSDYRQQDLADFLYPTSLLVKK